MPTLIKNARIIHSGEGMESGAIRFANGKVAAVGDLEPIPNETVIERLREVGVVPFVTHTRASVEQSRAAIEAGARHATHFYDVFPSPEETDPGVRPVGAVESYLADTRATVDFIADGCHVDPVAIQMAVRAKGCSGVAVITDANIGAGLPPAEYETSMGYRVRIEPGNATRIADPQHLMHGALAGSSLTMDAGMRNVLAWLDAHFPSKSGPWAPPRPPTSPVCRVKGPYPWRECGRRPLERGSPSRQSLVPGQACLRDLTGRSEFQGVA